MFSWISHSLVAALSGVHAALEPVFGAASWGWSVIAITIAIRLLLVPLAARQFHNMQRMQALQPQLAALKKGHGVDRDLRRRDPARYRERRQQFNEQMTELYREAGANPAAGFVPLLVQAPVFIALMRVLRGSPALKNAPFYLLTTSVAATAEFHGLGATAREAGLGGWLLVGAVLVASVMSQRQVTLARASTGGTTANSQQQMMVYAMPAFLAFVSFGFPIGVLLYWATSAGWQWGQQTVLLRRLARVGA